MIKNIVEADKADLSQLGYVIHLDQAAKRTDSWESTVSAKNIMDGACKIGLVRSEKLPIVIDKMERHMMTKEVMIAAEESIVVAVAPSISDDVSESPLIQNIICVLLKPGDVFVINNGVWHSACYGIDKKAMYYFLFEDSEEPLIWKEIEGGVCEIRV